MPIHNLGYREWEGERLSGGSRWTVVAGIGIQRAWQNMWLRRIAFVVWAAPLMYGVLIFFGEQYLNAQSAVVPPRAERLLAQLLPDEAMPEIQQTLGNLNQMSPEERITVVRPVLWKAVLLALQRSQMLGLVLVIGLVAPPLISTDVRSRAFLLYFSRPLTRFQYIFGKFMTVATFVSLVLLLPQLLLYTFAVLLSPDISVVAYTWDLPLRCIVMFIAVATPAILLALMLSSLTVETRFATFGWFAIWIFGLVAYMVMFNANQDVSGIALRLGVLFLLFGDVAVKLLGFSGVGSTFDTQIIFVIALSAICATIIFRKVSAPMKA